MRATVITILVLAFGPEKGRALKVQSERIEIATVIIGEFDDFIPVRGQVAPLRTLFLDAIEGLGVTPVVQNHSGTAVSSLADAREVHEGIADGRMKALLEVGHFHAAGVLWPDACDYLGDRIVLVHVKDQVGKQSVPLKKQLKMQNYLHRILMR